MTERHRLPNQLQSAPAMTTAEMVERAATTSIATHRTMRHLVLDIRKHFAHAVEAYGKFNAARIKLGQDLLEARARVEVGEEGSGKESGSGVRENQHRSSLPLSVSHPAAGGCPESPIEIPAFLPARRRSC